MTQTPPPARLPRDTLLNVVRHAPLVSVDLVCRNPAGQVLLGWRRNRPAQGSWFVPGGRILKGERVAQALARIAAGELGLADLATAAPRALGSFEHLYDDNFAGEPGTGTHYVVLAYALDLPGHWCPRHDDQHGELRWFDVAQLRTREDVHLNTRAYFDEAITATRTP